MCNARLRALFVSAIAAGLLVFSAQTAAAASSLIYVTNSGGDNIHVVEPADRTRWFRPSTGSRPRTGSRSRPMARASTPATRPTTRVDVFDQKTGKLIKKVALSGRPNNLAVAKDGRIVVAIAQEPGALDIIDPVKLERKVSILTNGRLHNTYVTPDSRFAIMGSTRTDIFTVIDLQKEEIVWELNLGKGVRPMTMETNPGRLDQARVHAAVGPQRLRDRRLRHAQDGRQDRAADGARHRCHPPSADVAVARHGRAARQQGAVGHQHPGQCGGGVFAAGPEGDRAGVACRRSRWRAAHRWRRCRTG